MARFRSGLEKSIAASLSARGCSYNYEKVWLPWKKKQRLTKRVKELHGVPHSYTVETLHGYLVDFELSNGILIEVKGRFTPADRTKMIAVMAMNPDKDIRMVFQRDDRLRPGSKDRNSDWCKKNNMKYAVGNIPSAWIKENKDEDK